MVFTFPDIFFSASKLYNLHGRFFRMLSQNTVDPLLFLFALFKMLLLLLSPQSHITETYLETNLIGGISLFLPNTANAKNTANATIHLFYPSEIIQLNHPNRRRNFTRTLHFCPHLAS